MVDPVAVGGVGPGPRLAASVLGGPLQAAGAVTVPARVAQVTGSALVAATVSALAALAYRWYVRESIPTGLAALLGVGVVALYLNTTELFGVVLSGIPGTPSGDPFATTNVLTNIATLAVAALATPLGRRVGDGFATNVGAVAGADRVEGDVGRLARTVGRVVPVTLPDEIATIEGYDPVPEATLDRLAGTTLVFPRRPNDAALRARLVERLKSDYGVSYVDVDLTDDGEVSYLAVGQRVAGLGPTLGPGACAVPVRADPANGASVGDVVQVWTAGDAGGGPSPERVATAELRATAGDVVTLAVDETDAPALSVDRTYRLLTLPADPRVDREFVSLLRAADETMGVVTVGEGSALVGVRVGDLPGTVIAVHPAAGGVDPLPGRGLELGAGDALYVVARPDALRELEARAGDAAAADAPGPAP